MVRICFLVLAARRKVLLSTALIISKRQQPQLWIINSVPSIMYGFMHLFPDTDQENDRKWFCYLAIRPISWMKRDTNVLSLVRFPPFYKYSRNLTETTVKASNTERECICDAANYFSVAEFGDNTPGYAHNNINKVEKKKKKTSVFCLMQHLFPGLFIRPQWGDIKP